MARFDRLGERVRHGDELDVAVACGFPVASTAAPVPRPPQPTSAILISSLPAA